MFEIGGLSSLDLSDPQAFEWWDQNSSPSPASPHSPTDRPAAPPQPEEHLRLAFELSADSVIDTCCDAAIWKKGPIVSIDTFSRVECTGLAKNTDHGNSSLAWKNA
ncbi:hypothetical protein BLNAU_17533 [Blattamonas nauphoetae]|uniref:Uncharacterized protein n=1 Tax=Blattamonas nauphoetae TaxID=2049346 RepID=A0ABQ9X6U6_9EUKA|nr:hypothetical protein BLNAU_17533 [Blattamonas nauphoetae]